MEYLFVPYEKNLELKRMGYNLPSATGYSYPNSNNVVTEAITYSQAFKWFRDEHGLYSSIVPKKCWPDNHVSGIEWYVSICGGDGKEIGPEGVYLYHEAEEACLEALIQAVKIENDEE